MNFPRKDDPAFVMKEQYSFDELLRLVAFLRNPEEGCPWDRVQTHESIQSSLIEEAWEAVNAIQNEGSDRLMDELGDVLMQVVMHAQMAAEEGSFDIDDIIANLCRKLISRHSHLFGHDTALTPEEVLKTWDRNKQKEKGLDSAAETLEEVPRGLPSLTRAYKIQKRAARYGFDWDNPEDPQAKITEEAEELHSAFLTYGKASPETEEEAGDLLFAVVNALRHMGVDPEIALGKASDKFTRRFSAVERELRSQNPDTEMEAYTLEELDACWNRVKSKEKEEGHASR